MFVENMTDYIMMSDKDLLKILDDANDWDDLGVDPCFRVLCDRHGVDYDSWDFNAHDCDYLFDLLTEKVEDKK